MGLNTCPLLSFLIQHPDDNADKIGPDDGVIKLNKIFYMLFDDNIDKVDPDDDEMKHDKILLPAQYLLITLSPSNVLRVRVLDEIWPKGNISCAF